MKVIVTGADQPLGGLLSTRLAQRHEVVAVGAAEKPADLNVRDYRQVDLCVPEQVDPIVVRADIAVHALPFDPLIGEGPQAEQELLERVARSTYVLITAAHRAGYRRVVLISRMSLFEDYPEEFVVAEDWQPLPRAEAESLAPHMAELVGREIGRTGRIEVFCLRFGELGDPQGTLADDAVAAVEEGMGRESEQYGYGWWLRHVVSGGRYMR